MDLGVLRGRAGKDNSQGNLEIGDGVFSQWHRYL
jgi:hypothetical protein